MNRDSNQTLPTSVKRYLRAVARRLNLPRPLCERIMSDFTTSLCARAEQGESWETILSSLGTAAEAAAELREPMREYTWRKSPWRFACLAAAVVCLARLFNYGWSFLMVRSFTHSPAGLGVIGGADGPTAVFVTLPELALLLRLLIVLVFLAACIFGFWRLGHLKQKPKDPEA